jgi:hypothetical protein
VVLAVVSAERRISGQDNVKDSDQSRCWSPNDGNNDQEDFEL